MRDETFVFFRLPDCGFEGFRTAKAELADQACTGQLKYKLIELHLKLIASYRVPGLTTPIFYSFHGLVAIFTCKKKMNSSRKLGSNSSTSGQYPGTATDLQGKQKTSS